MTGTIQICLMIFFIIGIICCLFSVFKGSKCPNIVRWIGSLAAVVALIYVMVKCFVQ